jgi:hypothetical protein
VIQQRPCGPSDAAATCRKSGHCHEVFPSIQPDGWLFSFQAVFAHARRVGCHIEAADRSRGPRITPRYADYAFCAYNKDGMLICACVRIRPSHGLGDGSDSPALTMSGDGGPRWLMLSCRSMAALVAPADAFIRATISAADTGRNHILYAYREFIVNLSCEFAT